MPDYIVNPIEKVSEFPKGLALKSFLGRTSKKTILYLWRGVGAPKSEQDSSLPSQSPALKIDFGPPNYRQNSTYG